MTDRSALCIASPIEAKPLPKRRTSTMGSSGHHHTNVAPRPVTRLPVFSTTVGNSSTRTYHSTTVAATSIVHEQPELLERYALFVLAVAEVDGGSDDEVDFILEADQNQTLVHASRTYSQHFALHMVDSAGTADTDSSVSLEQQYPLVLSIRRLTSEEQPVHVTLYLRTDHGPKAAAHHLLQLATAYLAPQVNLENLEMSNLATPFPAHQTTAHNDRSHSPALLLHTILEESARSFPHNIAVDEVLSSGGGHALSSSYTRRELTYRELDAKVSECADQIEMVLHRLGWPTLEDGDQRMVPIFLPNSTELLICMNAISKAGHSFCVLQMDAPEGRLRDMLHDLRAPGILGVGTNPWAGTQFGEDIIWIDYLNPTACLEGRLLDSNPVPPRRMSSYDSLAYIIYTSGSTGKPKGVRTTHRAAMAFIQAYDAGPGRLPMGPRLRWVVMSAPTFDIVLMDNFMPLYKGGTVCLAGRDLILTDPEAVINELRATATFVVTSMAMLLRPQNVPALTSLLVGGELIAQRIIDNFVPQPGDEKQQGSDQRRLIAIYGPTEATVTVSVQVCQHNSRPSVVGAPLPGTQYVVLDMNSPPGEPPRAVPLGVAGELAIISPQLAPGYLNRPEETAQAFIPDSPFGGGQLYKTGDRVRVVWSETTGEPQIDFLGRTKFGQVKLNGRRVELPEIENVLSNAQSAAQVGVLVVKSKLLVACVMPWDFGRDAETVEGQCRAEAARYLPSWMQPSRYFVMEQFPRTTSGKLNRRALEEVVANQLGTSVVSSEPAGATVAINGTGSKGAKPLSPAASSMNNPRTTLEATVGGGDSAVKNRLDDSYIVPKATAAVVYDALVASLGERTRLDNSTSLADMGLDSLRALVFLQQMRASGIQELGIHQVLAVSTVGELIETVEQQRAREAATLATNGVERPEINGIPIRSVITHQQPTNTDGIDVSVIAADDEDAVHELDLEAKLRHYDYHCRSKCLQALGLSNHQVEEVLPVTNVQARFIAMAVSPDVYDSERYVGRPHVEHFPYNVPSNMDPARLQRAVDAVLPRYDCFRTVFVPVTHPLAPFAQCILSPSVRKIPKVEITCDDDGADAASNSLWHETIHAAQRAAEASMSIDRPGIVVTWVWSQNRARCVFVLSLFHGIYDGTQLTYLRDAIMAEYDQPGCKPPMDLLPIRTAVNLTLSYDWVQTVMYWASRLAGVPGCRLGSRRPAPSADLPGSYTGVEETHMRILSVKSSMTMRDLDHAASSISTTLLTVVEAAWASVLAQTMLSDDKEKQQQQQQLDVQFGTVMGGRRHQDALRCMAPMLAALPMRLLINGASPLTNREACALLASQHREAQPYLQIPCPTMAHAQMGADRIDTVLLVQALQPDGPAAADALRELPGYNFQENLMAPYKEIDIGYPVVAEVWPGLQRWGEKMLLRCMYNARRPGYEFLTRDWVLGILSALDEAMVRITSEPDALFYTG
ncbi:hypothetical protein NLU13_9649 [Sarocladium strictum]|uniref:Uncharacterized protein n=1 Tax=Sarocladium strictum TaxID=5046 RepID=A0AA39GAH3_SARSR|nr:hypothetical protein NLU13_9649 [Sarocladium strictum]